MTRYASMFDRCPNGVLGAFLMLGDPGIAECEAYLDALVEGGADMVELGIPFSDPVADGPVIQAATVRALKAGVRTGDCLGMIARFRSRHQDIPVGILTYANIVNARGIEQFASDCADAGVDSLLVADAPSLEAEPYANAAKAAGIDLVMIAAPNTPAETIARIAQLSSGYTYCVARAGVTGADRRLQLDHSGLFAALKKDGAAPPILGFGISNPDQVAEAIAHGAAGVISGSAIVQRIANGASPAEVAAFVRELKGATEVQRLDFASVAL